MWQRCWVIIPVRNLGEDRCKNQLLLQDGFVLPAVRRRLHWSPALLMLMESSFQPFTSDKAGACVMLAEVSENWTTQQHAA